MDVTIHASFLPHDDPEASLEFYRDTLGFEVRGDVGNGKTRWITVGPAGQPSTSVVLDPPSANPEITEEERRAIAEMMAKGTYATLGLATTDLDGTFARLQVGGAEVVQEPTDQSWGVRDCAVRDPAGNLIRMQELRCCIEKGTQDGSEHRGHGFTRNRVSGALHLALVPTIFSGIDPTRFYSVNGWGIPIAGGLLVTWILVVSIVFVRGPT